MGCLLKGLKELNILQPPEPPYENVSIKDVFRGLRSLRVPQYCKVKSKKKNWSLESKFCEGVEGPLIAKVEFLQHQLEQGVSS